MSQNLITSGDIADRLGERFDRVQYILKTRRHIEPIGRAGIYKLYPESAVEAVRSEIELIDAKANTVAAT